MTATHTFLRKGYKDGVKYSFFYPITAFRSRMNLALVIEIVTNISDQWDRISGAIQSGTETIQISFTFF